MLDNALFQASVHFFSQKIAAGEWTKACEIRFVHSSDIKKVKKRVDKRPIS